MSNHRVRHAKTISESSSKSEATFGSKLNIALIAGTIVFLGSLFGILLRPTADLAAFRPVNAILLGLFVRAPRFASTAAWIAAVVGFVVSGLVAGDPPLATIILSAANMVSVVVGYLIYRRYDESIRRLKRPRAIWTMMISVTAAGVAAGIAGAVIDPILFHGTIWHGASFWLVTTVMNHIAILPVILSAPDMS